MLVARTDLAANTLAEFTAYAANTGDMSFGSGGAGSSTHLGCVLLNPRSSVRVQHIPYRGSAPAMQDFAGGRIDYLCDSVTTAMPQIQARAVRASRYSLASGFQSCRTFRPQTSKDLRISRPATGSACSFRAGTPAAIIRRLNEATVAAMTTPSVQERMQTLGTDLVSPQRPSPIISTALWQAKSRNGRSRSRRAAYRSIEARPSCLWSLVANCDDHPFVGGVVYRAALLGDVFHYFFHETAGGVGGNPARAQSFYEQFGELLASIISGHVSGKHPAAIPPGSAPRCHFARPIRRRFSARARVGPRMDLNSDDTGAAPTVTWWCLNSDIF